MKAKLKISAETPNIACYFDFGFDIHTMDDKHFIFTDDEDYDLGCYFLNKPKRKRFMKMGYG